MAGNSPAEGTVYYSLDELNWNIRRIVDSLNNRKLQSQSFSRREVFGSYEKPEIRLLTNGHFSPCEYRYFGKVLNNYHLLFDEHYDSVPCTMYTQPAS